VFTAIVLSDLGLAALGSGRPEEAWQLLEESIAIQREVAQVHWRMHALALSGYAARGLSQLAQAERRFRQALHTAAERRDHLVLLYALPGVACLLADRSGRSTPDVERAVELYALAARYPFVAHSRWFEDVAGRHIAAAAEALPPEVVAAAQERGRERDLWATVEELLAELEG
jgi:hypothetical protein